jgi:GNAT superfamily N-acetyltransferase
VSPPIDLVPFTARHLDGALALSREAGWPHRPEDWRIALALSSGVAAIEAGGRVVGTALVTGYGPDCSSVNMVIVEHARRGQGLGRRLMAAALDLAGDRELRLVATQEGLPLYEKLGFRRTGVVLQHQGIAEPHARLGEAAFEPEVDADELAALDAVAFGASRSDLFAWLRTAATFAVLRRGGRLAGFAALRPFGRGEVVGPVVAADAADARDLVACCIGARPGAFLRIDTTEDAGLSPWLAEIGLAHAGGGIAMRRGGEAAERSPPFKAYALASQALG